LLPIPAPVTGLILLYAELTVRGRLPDNLGVLADRLLQFLGMLFVPSGVGVIAYLDVFKAEAMPIFAAVIGGDGDNPSRDDDPCEPARHRNRKTQAA
jgi:holin-like protein